MKLIASLTLGVLLCFFSCHGQSVGQSHFWLSGKIQGLDTGKLYFAYLDKDNKYIFDSIQIKKGRFKFNGSIAHTTFAAIGLKDGENKYGYFSGPNYTGMSLEPANMEFSAKIGNFEDFNLTGSFSQNQLFSLKKQKAVLLKRENQVVKLYQERKALYESKEGTTDSATLQLLKRQVDSLYVVKESTSNDYIDVDVVFARTHLDSYLSPQLLLNNCRYVSFDTLKYLYGSLARHIQQSFDGIRLKAQIEKIDSILSITTPADFTRKEFGGSLLTLNEISKGRVILIDFWASWCEPCRMESPHLIELYKKYRTKNFEIIGIASDNKTVSQWRAAILKDGVGIWKNVLVSPLDSSKESKGSLSDLNSVSSYPTQLLIDEKGTIIARFGDFGKSFSDLDKVLESIFGY